METEASTEHTPDHTKLIQKGLNVTIADKLDEIFKTDDDDSDTYTYGPDPTIMADILEQSEYQLHITAYERILRVPPEDRLPSAEPSPGYEVICLGIPPDMFEDQLIKLFENDDKEIYEFKLLMNPLTDQNRGQASITFAQKEDAEYVQRKLNNFEIKPGRKLQLDLAVSDVERPNFPSETNDMHICKESSLSDYCTCVTEMLDEISSLKKGIELIERNTDKEKVERAKEINKMQYARHSLRMESIEPTKESLKKIISATDYAVNHVDAVTMEHILNIHKRIEPHIKETGMFRNEDIYINGIYDIPVYPSAVDLVVSEMEEFVKFLNDLRNVDNDETAIIMAATAKTNFLLTHPFFDGNGRLSRVIFSGILKLRNYPFIVIPISESTRYYEALKIAQQTEDFTLIYRFLCRCIRKTMIAYLKLLM